MSSEDHGTRLTRLEERVAGLEAHRVDMAAGTAGLAKALQDVQLELAHLKARFTVIGSLAAVAMPLVTYVLTRMMGG